MPHFIFPQKPNEHKKTNRSRSLLKQKKSHQKLWGIWLLQNQSLQNIAGDQEKGFCKIWMTVKAILHFDTFLIQSIDFHIKVSKFQNDFLMSYIFQKTNAKIWRISALESKKGSNHKIKALYNVFNTLNSKYNHM